MDVTPLLIQRTVAKEGTEKPFIGTKHSVTYSMPTLLAEERWTSQVKFSQNMDHLTRRELIIFKTTSDLGGPNIFPLPAKSNILWATSETYDSFENVSLGDVTIDPRGRYDQWLEATLSCIMIHTSYWKWRRVTWPLWNTIKLLMILRNNLVYS